MDQERPQNPYADIPSIDFPPPSPSTPIIVPRLMTVQSNRPTSFQPPTALRIADSTMAASAFTPNTLSQPAPEIQPPIMNPPMTPLSSPVAFPPPILPVGSVSTKTCNCKNSKCVKLYCDCFSSKQFCSKNCHCIDCNNHDQSEVAINNCNSLNLKSADGGSAILGQNAGIRDSRAAQASRSGVPKAQIAAAEDTMRGQKGCACKKSGCMKKYCECFQAGIVCSDACKCVQWYKLQNTKTKNWKFRHIQI